MTITETIKVFLVEDHELVRRGLTSLLSGEEGIELIGTEACVADATRALAELQPDVAIIDLRLPDGLGTAIVKDLSRRDPAPKTLILTSYLEDSLVLEAMAVNVNGYLLKNIEGEALIRAVKDVHAGRAVYSNEVAGVMASLVRGETEHRGQRERLDMLSAQEYRVLAEVSKGRSNKEVAEALGLSEKTVKNYLSNLLGKLGLNSRTEAAVMFVKYGRQRNG